MNRIKSIALAAIVIAGPLSVGAAHAQSVRGERADVRDARQNVRDARQDLREERRDLRQAQRWNQRQHNGFYVANRFHYGQPTYQQMQRRDYRPAYQQWRRGDRLPNYARTQYRQVDWRRDRMRAPPRGYQYVRDDRGQVLLVGVATGVILSILLNN